MFSAFAAAKAASTLPGYQAMPDSALASFDAALGAEDGAAAATADIARIAAQAAIADAPERLRRLDFMIGASGSGGLDGRVSGGDPRSYG